MEVSHILHLLTQHLCVLNERAQRTHRLCRDLERLPDSDIAQLLEAVYRGAMQEEAGCLLLLDALGEFEIVTDYLARRLSAIYEAADREGLFLAAEWLAPFPLAPPPGTSLRAHHDLSQFTLGERRALARRAKPLLLEKLLVDPDPAVIRNLLNHPRLSEREVVRVAAKRPANPDVLKAIYEHKRWFDRYPVKLALLNNPQTPPRLTLLILPHIAVPDLLELAKGRRFSPGFLALILELKGARLPSDALN